MLLQAITANGGISASWVLAGVISLMCILLWRMLTTMQSDIKTLTQIVNRHDTQLELHSDKIENNEEAYNELVKKNQSLAEEIIVKLKLANQLK